MKEIVKNVYHVGANDTNIDLFEGQYKLTNGMGYNSYLIKDEKNVLFDTIDKNLTEEWINNIEEVLKDGKLDYLVISHLEPDHAFNIGTIIKKYPDIKLIGNTMTFNILPKFFNDIDISEKIITVKEGEIFEFGNHKLQFFMAPMVHWPEVMMTYSITDKILFSADAFGKFGIVKENDEWLDEARRFYIGIVGKYGPQVQAVLNKVSKLDIKMICSLHGPILNENLGYYIDKYNKWSTYTPEEEGVVIVCSSIYGNTLEAAKYLKDKIGEDGKKVELYDITKDDIHDAVAKSFKYNRLIVASSSYNAGLFPPMEHFLNKLKERNYQKRKVAIIENGSWAPSSGKIMKNILQEMKEIDIINPIITIKSKMNDDTKKELEELANII